MEHTFTKDRPRKTTRNAMQRKIKIHSLEICGKIVKFNTEMNLFLMWRLVSGHWQTTSTSTTSEDAETLEI